MQARPVGLATQLVKWARRRPAHAALAVVGAAGLAFFALRISDGTHGSHGTYPSHHATPAIDLAPGEAVANRHAAGWLLSVCANPGQVVVQMTDGQRVTVHPGEPLPTGDWSLEGFWLDRTNAPGLPLLNEAEFVSRLAGLTRLKSVMVRFYTFSSAACAFMANNPDLEHIEIYGPPGDGILPHLAGLKNIRYLALTWSLDRGEVFRGRGLEKLACLPVLEKALFYRSGFDDAAAAALTACPRLISLHLEQTAITDAALTTLAGIRSLQELNLTRTAVTDAGVAEIRKARPDCSIVR